MATYKEIRGTQIEAVATDPSNPVEGQIWYNTTSNVLKGQSVTSTGSFASIPSLNNGRTNLAGAGTATSALVFNGYFPPSPSPEASALTELYNGSSWTEVNDANEKVIGGGGAGVSNTSALRWGGTHGPATGETETESWNGTNWTEVNDLNTGRDLIPSAGTGPATAIVFAGGRSSTKPKAELWNGTNWTEVNDMNSGKSAATCFGTSTAAIITAGAGGPDGATESWNGTNWTEVNDLNTPRSQGWGCGASQSAGILMGGESPNRANVELFNGTNWSETTDIPAGRNNGAASKSGTTSSLLWAGGTEGSTPSMTVSMEWTGPGVAQTRTFDDS